MRGGSAFEGKEVRRLEGAPLRTGASYIKHMHVTVRWITLVNLCGVHKRRKVYLMYSGAGSAPLCVSSICSPY